MSTHSSDVPSKGNGSPEPANGCNNTLPMFLDLRELFQCAFEQRASDIHLTEHTPPMLRIDGDLHPTTIAPLTRAETKRLIYNLLTDRQKTQFERELELDISVEVGGIGRVRVNVHMQRGKRRFGWCPPRFGRWRSWGCRPWCRSCAASPTGWSW